MNGLRPPCARILGRDPPRGEVMQDDFVLHLSALGLPMGGMQEILHKSNKQLPLAACPCPGIGWRVRFRAGWLVAIAGGWVRVPLMT